MCTCFDDQLKEAVRGRNGQGGGEGLVRGGGEGRSGVSYDCLELCRAIAMVTHYLSLSGLHLMHTHTHTCTTHTYPHTHTIDAPQPVDEDEGGYAGVSL